jgi:hypothetical protein
MQSHLGKKSNLCHANLGSIMFAQGALFIYWILKVRYTQYGFCGQMAFKLNLVEQGGQPSRAGWSEASSPIWEAVIDKVWMTFDYKTFTYSALNHTYYLLPSDQMAYSLLVPTSSMLCWCKALSKHDMWSNSKRWNIAFYHWASRFMIQLLKSPLEKLIISLL